MPLPLIVIAPAALKAIAVVGTAILITAAATDLYNKFHREGSYRPAGPLPEDRAPDGAGSGDAIPSSDHPHTQIGTGTSNNPRAEPEYTKGRTWGPRSERGPRNNRPKKDTDFTDHGRPQTHPNPHQHTYDPKTGARGRPEPLTVP